MRDLKRLADGFGDCALALVAAALVATVLGVDLLSSANWPTGGDTASHLLYARLYADELLFSGDVLPWLPEVFGGLPFLSYYFPLPFIVIAALSKLLGFAPAFKWGAFLAAMLLPGAAYAGARRWLGLPRQAAFFGALGSLAFLLHEQNSIWGGNLLSTLAGEFAYSYGLLFAVLTLMAWTRAALLGRGWVPAALLEAACGFSHGFPLLVVGFSTILLLLDSGSWPRFRQIVWLLARGHLLAFALLGGWLWPMIEMHGLTIPNDAAFPLSSWRDLLPATLWPVLAAGLVGAAALAVPSVRQAWTPQRAFAVRYFSGTAGLAALGFIVGDRIGLADIRFFPLVWLLGALVCGWLFGQALAVLGAAADAGSGSPRLAQGMLAAACSLGLLGWLGAQIREAPDWSQWNHSGLEARPQWHNLSRLFPAMQGDLWSPRLLFEHDPANNDIGSTRTLEALPMFLKHRPVLEGLFMESALLGPAIYQLQSEVSARPSSPLVRFPAGSLDPQFAAAHMNFLHADMLLLRSAKAQAAIEASGLFARIAAAEPFALYRLRRFDSQLVQVVTRPLDVRPRQDWMEHAFAWFRSRSRFSAELPVYSSGAALPTANLGAAPAAKIQPKRLTRHELAFDTDTVGRPHLVKIAYHPRWQLASKGSLHLAAPGFMLVVPAEREIRLVYGHTPIGKLGMAATAVAIFSLALIGWRRRKTPVALGAALTETNDGAGMRRRMPLLAGWTMLVVTGAFFALRSPERAYGQAWTLMKANHYEAAGDLFLTAFELRRPPAKKEEALFWLAKSRELAGRREEAKAGYRRLCENYHGYWLAESLYTLALLERLDHHDEDAARLARRLREEFPANQWTRQLDLNK